MATLPTLGVNELLNSYADMKFEGTEPYLQKLASPDDSKYIYVDTNASVSTYATFKLDTMPSDFGSMDTLSVNLRYFRSAGTVTNIWDYISIRVVKSGGSDLVSTYVIEPHPGPTTPTNTGVLNFTGVNTSDSKADWDGARVTISLGTTRCG
jgi:hypothetical protein